MGCAYFLAFLAEARGRDGAFTGALAAAARTCRSYWPRGRVMSRARTSPWERLNAATCFSTVARSAAEGSSGSEATWNQTVM